MPRLPGKYNHDTRSHVHWEGVVNITNTPLATQLSVCTIPNIWSHPLRRITATTMDRMWCEKCGHVRYGSRLDCFDDDDDDEICSSCGEYYTYRGIEDQYHRNDGDFFGPLPCDNHGEDYIMDEEDGFTYDENYCNGIGDDDDGDWDEDEYFDNYTEVDQKEMKEEDVDVNSKVDDEERTRERRRYGLFRCYSCRQPWGSSYVFCRKERGTFRPLYRQDCKKCLVGCLPFKVQRLRCSRCLKTNCTCKRRNTNPKKPHRRDLCHRCRSGRRCQSYGKIRYCPTPLSRTMLRTAQENDSE